MLHLQFTARRLWPAPTTATAATGYHSSAAVAYTQGGGGASMLLDSLDWTSDAYARNAAAVGGLLSDLRARVSQWGAAPPGFLQVLAGGGAEGEAEQVVGEAATAGAH
ncbi:hypothetical protein E2562_029900 [Oryza meyeriana var. granulata]|uniref:Uncharacterized protein n=1 Tax=Oryza meyeriana var. granulata TaxID=110450 RepID=A0A6G1CT32_9ORYZ|nr:hypothetical protein E2562_029900 [Oryza meyeriana var. granulata]